VALDSDSILSITSTALNPIGDTFTIMDYASLVGQVSNGKPSTVAGYETVWRIYLAPYLQEITLRDFRTSDAANLFIEIYRQHGIGRTTLQHCKRRLSGLFKLVRNQGAFDSPNPIEAAMIPKKAAAPNKTHAATPDDVMAILELRERARAGDRLAHIHDFAQDRRR
jgi:hypothetical protein